MNIHLIKNIVILWYILIKFLSNKIMLKLCLPTEKNEVKEKNV